MDASEFRQFGGAMLQYITDYLENIRERRVTSTVQEGYLRDLIPEEAPEDPERWQDIMKDIERVIMPGVTHWQSPNFHAYFPAGNSYPAIVADMLSGAINCIGLTWIASPSCTELEVVMMDWLAKLLSMPDQFSFSKSNGIGGGVIQGSTSESTLLALLSAKAKTVERCKITHDLDETTIVGKLVAYISDQSNSSLERAGLLGGVKVHTVKTDGSFSMQGAPLQAMIDEDKRNGLIPFYVATTLGTTSSCAFDNIDEIGDVCLREKLWLHVDAAYGGSAFICEEYRHIMKGIEKVNSFNFSPHKWLLVNFDCSVMWVQNSKDIVDTYNIHHTVFLQERDTQTVVPDYRHWQIPLGRRFRSLKLWFVMRTYGRKKLQEHIRGQVALAHEFEQLVLQDTRFEVVAPVILGLVCFCLKEKTNDENETLMKTINERGKIHIIPTTLHGKYVLRFAICSPNTNSEDVKFAWKEIQDTAKELFGG